MTQQSEGPLPRTIALFANMLAGAATLMLAPLLVIYLRSPVHTYLLTAFSHQIASLGSWLFIALVAACAAFGLSATLQMLFMRAFTPRIGRSSTPW